VSDKPIPRQGMPGGAHGSVCASLTGMGRRLAVLFATVVVVLSCSPPSGSPEGSGTNAALPGTLRLSQPRAVHRATLLSDGSVLITGGCTEPGCGGFEAGQRSELYHARDGMVPGPTMSTPRAGHTATLLDDGRVLLTGGYLGEGEGPTASAEVYDPLSSQFALVSDLGSARADHTATLPPDGKVMIAGGVDGSGTALATTEVFDPATAAFAPGPDLSTPRAAHVATSVGDLVLLVGGTNSSEALRTTDVLSHGAWMPGPRLLAPRIPRGMSGLPLPRSST
jgi:hypothetical protein